MWTNRRREQLRAAPFPPEWKRVLEGCFPAYRGLSGEDREELEGHIQVFLAEKQFEGLGGLELADEMKVCIAAQACLLLLHRETEYYPGLKSILVYPSSYFAKTTRDIGSGVVHEGEDNRLGEAWNSGAIVLAWDAVHHGTANPNDGHNVVLHEFAHLLDFEDGVADGAPKLGADESWLKRRSRYASWARVLQKEYEQLQAKAEKGQKALLNHYGATDPAEFFAVATEAFFERAHTLRRKHPELYEELKTFYRLDPALWTEQAG